MKRVNCDVLLLHFLYSGCFYYFLRILLIVSGPLKDALSDAILGKWNPFKNDEKYFLFHLKSFFCSPDIEFFVLTFYSCRKTAWLEG